MEPWGAEIRAETAAPDVLFVCTANVCRSPMAAAILEALALDRGLIMRTRSAGTAARDGEDVDEYARVALEEVGIQVAAHRSRRVRARMLSEAGLVLAMSNRHVAGLRELSADARAEVRPLHEYAGAGSEVPDPHGKGLVSYRAVARQLLEQVGMLVEILEADRALPNAQSGREPRGNTTGFTQR